MHNQQEDNEQYRKKGRKGGRKIKKEKEKNKNLCNDKYFRGS